MTEGDLWLNALHTTTHIEKEYVDKPVPGTLDQGYAIYWCGMQSAPNHLNSNKNLAAGVIDAMVCKRCQQNRDKRGKA